MKPTCITDEYGNKEWRLNGKVHREDGPALEYANGTKFWYLNGKVHREDGPAIELANGDKWWYLKGLNYPFEDYISKLTDQDTIDRLVAQHVMEAIAL